MNRVFVDTAVIDFGEKIRTTRTVQIAHVSEEIEKEAWQIFEQYADKDFSFTDCTSFVIMRQLGLEEAFMNDRHCEQMRFVALLKP